VWGCLGYGNLRISRGLGRVRGAGVWFEWPGETVVILRMGVSERARLPVGVFIGPEPSWGSLVRRRLGCDGAIELHGC